MAERQDPDDTDETGFGTDAKLYRLKRLSTADFESGERFNAWRETAYGGKRRARERQRPAIAT